MFVFYFFFFQAEDGIRDVAVTGVQTCALPICPFPGPPGAWYRGAINAGPAPIDLVMFTQASQHGLVQLLPDTSGIPVAQTPPASHAAAVAQGLGKVFPWNACLQHEQDAVEGRDRKSTRLNS